MQPTNVILDAIANLLAADPTTLAPVANALHVHLAIAAFTPGPTLSVGDFTEATFTGGAALPAGVGACQEFTDPVTGQRIVQLNEPAGGWHWHCTAGTGLPQTVYGYYVTDHADAVLYGCARLPANVTITASGQGLDVDQVRFTFLNTSPM